MQSLGIDLGTTFVKTSKERIFPSGISENIYLSNNVMELEGKRYAMGLSNQKAIIDTNINKSLNRNARQNYIYALFMEARDIDCIYTNVTIGLPCSIWKKDQYVNDFKELLKIEDFISVKVNGLEKRISVENLDIIPEGSSAFYTINYKRFGGRKVLFLDIGSLTLNQLQFENSDLTDMHTDEFGILKVYKDMAEKITTETGYNTTMEDMHDILSNGLSILGKTIDVEEFIKPIAKDYCEMIHKNLQLKWSIDTIPYVCLIGGGSVGMYKYIKEYIPHAELLKDAQILAAIGMDETVGV